MITLHHTEIDIKPDRPHLVNPVQDGKVGLGHAVIEIRNTSELVNAYTLRVRCKGNPYWQDRWYTLRSLPDVGAAAGQEAVRPDEIGTNPQWLRVFLPAGGARRVILDFDQVQRRPAFRAGAYDLEIVVETQVLQAGAAAEDLPIVKRKARATLHPYHRWSVAVSPVDTHVRFRRPRGAMQVEVTNESNDWLYCRLETPRQRELTVEIPTKVIAVPPPDPGATSSVRTLDCRGTAHLRKWRGDATPLPLTLNAVRVDAPSVPPLPEDVEAGRAVARVGAAVLQSDTTDIHQAPDTPQVVYHPLFPGSIAGFPKWLLENAKSLVALALMLSLLVGGAWVMYQSIAYQLKVNVKANWVNPQGDAASRMILIGGQFLSATGTRIWVEDADTHGEIPELHVRPIRGANLPEAVQNALRKVRGKEEFIVVVPPGFRGHSKLLVYARRFGKIPLLSLFSSPVPADFSVDVKQPPPVEWAFGDRVEGATSLKVYARGGEPPGKVSALVGGRERPATPVRGEPGAFVVQLDEPLGQDYQPEVGILVDGNTVKQPESLRLTRLKSGQSVPPSPPPLPLDAIERREAYIDLLYDEPDAALEKLAQTPAEADDAVGHGLKALALALSGKTDRAQQEVNRVRAEIADSQDPTAAALANLADGACQPLKDKAGRERMLTLWQDASDEPSVPMAAIMFTRANETRTGNAQNTANQLAVTEQSLTPAQRSIYHPVIALYEADVLSDTDPNQAKGLLQQAGVERVRRMTTYQAVARKLGFQ